MTILGPVPCQGCHELVVYAPSCRHAGDEVEPHGALRWCDLETGRAHRCPSRARAKWDNTGVGDGDESNTLRADPRSAAITQGAGVVASFEVMAR